MALLEVQAKWVRPDWVARPAQSARLALHRPSRGLLEVLVNTDSMAVQDRLVRLAWVRPAQSARLDALARKVKMASMVRVIQDLRGPLEA